MSSWRMRARVVLLVVFEVGALVALHRLGGQPWLQVEPDLATWLSAARPEDAVVVVLRYAGLATGWWLVATTLLYLLARATRVPAAVRAVGWATLPAVRRVADRAVAVSLASSLVTAAPALAAPAPTPVVVEAPAGIAVPQVLPPALAGDLPGGDVRGSPRVPRADAADPAELSVPASAPPGAPEPDGVPAPPPALGESRDARGVEGVEGAADVADAADMADAQGRRARVAEPTGPSAGAPSSGGTSTASATSDEASAGEAAATVGGVDGRSSTATDAAPVRGRTSVSGAAGAPGSPGPTAASEDGSASQSGRPSPEPGRSAPEAARPAAGAASVAAPGAGGALDGTVAATHVIAAGEHLWGVAEAHLAAVRGRAVGEAEIAAYWRRVVAASTPRSGDPDLVHPGERVVLPPVDAPEA